MAEHPSREHCSVTLLEGDQRCASWIQLWVLHFHLSGHLVLYPNSSNWLYAHLKELVMLLQVHDLSALTLSISMNNTVRLNSYSRVWNPDTKQHLHIKCSSVLPEVSCNTGPVLLDNFSSVVRIGTRIRFLGYRKRPLRSLWFCY